ncbi:MAG: M13 family metallopeptidase [Verrucomicrobia bacterium]|nr:MAG: M13 family metallopeptidase [Verrucomicrobiota bacterium]
MKRFLRPIVLMLSLAAVPASQAADEIAKVPRFSVGNMDRSVDPTVDFYRYATGTWLKQNPVPADKSRWSGFEELQERNWQLIHALLDDAARHTGNRERREVRQVGAFYKSSMDTNRLEALGFHPLDGDLRRIARIRTTDQLFRLLGDLHERGVGGMFGGSVVPDAKNSSVYQLKLGQGGLGLPDRDYYLSDGFAKQREAYRAHVAKMLSLLGDPAAEAVAAAATVLDLETELARACKSRVEMRDPDANYNKLPLAEIERRMPAIHWRAYLDASHVARPADVNLGQTNFFAALDRMVATRPLADWKTYLRWHLVLSSAPFLHAVAERESFAFYGTVLRGQPQQEPRWQRAAKTIDGSIGEALGALYVEKHFPPAARARMAAMVDNLKAVFRDRLGRLEWMSPDTRRKALAKFDRFTQKIGHPEKFREYRFRIAPDDLLGNVQRASVFESRREAARVGKPVDRSEWHMTPQTVNAYFNPLQNEIVFPAGILQPPFFDLDLDDAVNYGAIGVVIGHEITHGYDDQGRKYDADGNLNDWWTEADAREFQSRAQKLVEQYGTYEALPGKHVNGLLTLGENIADLGGTSIAYEALQRALAKDPSGRRTIDGFTPEQRFFLSLSQLWRTNWREAELQRRLTVDPHSPGQYRAVGPHVNLDEFHAAFGIRAGTPMFRKESDRARIW